MEKEKKSKSPVVKKTARKSPVKSAKSDTKEVTTKKETNSAVKSTSVTKNTKTKTLSTKTKTVKKEPVVTQTEKIEKTEVKKPSKKEELKSKSAKTEVKNEKKNLEEERGLKVKKTTDSKREKDASSFSNERPYARYNRGFPNKFGRRKRFCKLCAKGIEYVDYKDVDLLYKYLNHNLKIASRKVTSACSKHQRRISNAIKRARIVSLIPFIKD